VIKPFFSPSKKLNKWSISSFSISPIAWLHKAVNCAERSRMLVWMVYASLRFVRSPPPQAKAQSTRTLHLHLGSQTVSPLTGLRLPTRNPPFGKDTLPEQKANGTWLASQFHAWRGSSSCHSRIILGGWDLPLRRKRYRIAFC